MLHAVTAARASRPIDMGLAFRTLHENAPTAPMSLVRLAAEAMANPRACSDALLIFADAIDQCAADGFDCTPTLPAAARFQQHEELRGLRQLSAALRGAAPGYARACNP